MLKALIKRITDYLNHRHEWVEKERKRHIVLGDYDSVAIIYKCSDISCAKVRKVRI